MATPTRPVLAAIPADGLSGLVYDAGIDAQRAAERHLAECVEAEYAEGDWELVDDGETPLTDLAELPESPAVGPFDGCDTCVVREVLHAAWPVFEADIIRQLRGAGFDEAADHLIAQQS